MAKTKEFNSKLKKEGDFVPPDGGWGWMIILAAGLSNLSTLPMLQQFGLLFRDRLAVVGVTGSSLTTIINMNSALTSCVGLANGPVFKTFSYRTVALTGATIIFISLVLTTFSFNFTTYLLSFSVLYGMGFGLSSSASALALNTYWKKRRRLATGLAWTATGLGPIIWPQIFKYFLFPTFGTRGTSFFLCGFALHSFACALLLQPVEWHVKKPKQKKEELLAGQDTPNNSENMKTSSYFSSAIRDFRRFSSQYLYNEDDPVNTGYEITDPGIPMMVRANDGYFSKSRQSRSRLSSTEGSNKNSRLNSKKPSMTNLNERSRKSSTLYLNESKKNSSSNLGILAFERDPGKKPNVTNLLENRSRKSSTYYLNDSKKNSSTNLGALVQDRETKQKQPKRKISITDIQIPESEIEDCPTLKAPQDLKADEKAVLEKIDPNQEKSILDKAEQHMSTNKSTKSFKNTVEALYGDQYNKDNHSNTSYKNIEDNEEKAYMKNNHSNQSYKKVRQRKKSNNFNYESEVLKLASLKLEQYLKDKDDEKDANVDKMKLLMHNNLDDDVFENNDKVDSENEDEDVKLTFSQKVVLFFDLDLIKDFTFVNLMLGITLANFNELNFSILTPFILGKYNLSPAAISDFMSILAGIDVGVRFCIPFVAGRIGWDNNSFFLFGVLLMAIGRVVLSLSQEIWVVMLVACIIGFGKGLRTVFMALVIPTYVPLHKLPGASGLQLLSAGIVYIALGPVVGWIFENASLAVTLHSLNIFTWLTALSWGLEKFIRSRTRNESNEELVAA